MKAQLTYNTASNGAPRGHSYGIGHRILRSNYAMVGKALLYCESQAPLTAVLQTGSDFLLGVFGNTVRLDGWCWGSSNDSSWVSAEFRAGVSTVSTEVLESYLEDLLNPEVKDEALAIGVSLSRRVFIGISIVTGALVPVAALALLGVLNVSSRLSVVVLGVITITASLAITSRLLVRRLRFAQVVSREIARRRGRGQLAAATVAGGLYPSPSPSMCGA